MSKGQRGRARRDHTDPRRAGGDIAGPGGPFDENAVIIDTTDGVLLDDMTVAMVEPYRDGQPGEPVAAVMLAGRINKTTERSRVLYLTDREGAAKLVADLMAMYSRAGQNEAFAADIATAMQALRADGAL